MKPCKECHGARSVPDPRQPGRASFVDCPRCKGTGREYLLELTVGSTNNTTPRPPHTMRPIAPRIDGADEFSIAEDQHDFMPVTACLVEFSDGVTSRVLRYTFTPAEREAIAAGKDIYFGTPYEQQLQPHWLMVGSPTEARP